MSVPLYAFKIELKEIKPKIWRKFFVPSDVSLAMFHEAIQQVMGWLNYHFYSYKLSGVEYLNPDPHGLLSEIPNTKEIDLKKVKLYEFYPYFESNFEYLYDFGDGWTHRLKVIDTDYTPLNSDLIFGCLAGARRCPIEDCGGTRGYYEVLKILADKNHEEYEDTLIWAPEGYDPEKFDLKAVNNRLMLVQIKYTLRQIDTQATKMLVDLMIKQ
ncbi:MAG: plasmid pRiA4b ORF-3 family protein [Deltaproteobacteria bacterium]|nr:plasmid pRiA4b ORF-3 family protein [Deltaproteobacteria bacterium]